jgi:hemerythrin superfamily protein
VPSALEVLAADHRTVEDLFRRFRESGDESTAAQICDELTVHTQVEESLVYPELQRIDATLEQEARAEHAEARELIERLRAMSGGDIVDLMRRLEDAVTHHVSEEEAMAFPQLEALGAERLDALGQEIVDAKARLGAP